MRESNALFEAWLMSGSIRFGADPTARERSGSREDRCGGTAPRDDAAGISTAAEAGRRGKNGSGRKKQRGEGYPFILMDKENSIRGGHGQIKLCLAC